MTTKRWHKKGLSTGSEHIRLKRYVLIAQLATYSLPVLLAVAYSFGFLLTRSLSLPFVVSHEEMLYYGFLTVLKLIPQGALLWMGIEVVRVVWGFIISLPAWVKRVQAGKRPWTMWLLLIFTSLVVLAYSCLFVRYLGPDLFFKDSPVVPVVLSLIILILRYPKISLSFLPKETPHVVLKSTQAFLSIALMMVVVSSSGHSLMTTPDVLVQVVQPLESVQVSSSVFAHRIVYRALEQ